MEKKLHETFDSNNPSGNVPGPHHFIQQSLLEEEFSAEMTFVQNQKMSPRPEAVEVLLQMIAQQSVAEQH
jgi:hypothetical protein